MSSQDLSRLEAYEEQIKSLSSRYWVAHRKQWIESDKLWSPSAKRALTRQRKHKDWYLSGVLREDCANRGGCCGRSCGCCERTRMTKVNTDRVHDRGHCTTACSCCLEAHGIDGEHLDMKGVDEVHFSRDRDPHTMRLFRGYIFYLNGMEWMSKKTTGFAYGNIAWSTWVMWTGFEWRNLANRAFLFFSSSTHLMTGWVICGSSLNIHCFIFTSRRLL